MDTRMARTVLAVAIAVCLVSGGVAAIALSGDDGSDVSTAGSATTVAESAGAQDGSNPAEPQLPSVGGSTVPRPDDGAPQPTVAPAVTPAGGTPRDPGPAVPPKVGRYRYRLTVDGDSREVTALVEEKGRSGDETRFVVTLETEQGKISNEVSWRRGSVLLLSSRIESMGSECDWEPDLVLGRFPMAAGAEWSSDGSCNSSAFGQQFRIRQQDSQKVNELTRVTVGGEVLDVWSIASTQRTEFSGSGPGQQFTSNATGTVLFSPKYGLNVKESRKATSPQGEMNVETELLSVKPS